MSILVLTVFYFVFFFVSNTMFFQICAKVMDELRFGKITLYVFVLINSIVFSIMTFGFNQLPTITYLMLLFGSIIQLSILFKNNFPGILMYSFMATIYLVCIESVVISSGSLILQTSLAQLTHTRVLLLVHIVISWFICMLLSMAINKFVPGQYLQIINQNREQTLFVLGFLFIATIYLTLNSFIYGHADTFDTRYLPLHQIITPVVWIAVLSLAVVLLIRFDYLHGYKAKSELLQKKVEHQETELLISKSRAERDALVGAYNKSTTEEKIEEALAQEEKGAFFILDIDDFKQINDQKGHPFGDKVLVYLSKRLANNFRQQDIVGRIGGDEFVIFKRNVSSREQIEERAKMLCDDMRVPFVDDLGESAVLSISIGIALAPQDGCDFETLYNNADTALYQSKNKGKNTFSFYNPATKLS